MSRLQVLPESSIEAQEDKQVVRERAKRGQVWLAGHGADTEDGSFPEETKVLRQVS